MNDTILRCKDVIKIFPSPADKDTYATLRGINLELNQGDFCIIIGQSGVGKTTLLKIFFGDLLPSAGTIEILNQKLHKLKQSEILKLRRSHIGIMVQNPRKNVFPELNVYQNAILSVLFEKSSQKSKFLIKHAKHLLIEFNLESKLNYQVKQLSGGEIQRLAIIMALVQDPSIIILDEPTSQLDYANAQKIIDYLKKICKDEQKTIIVVTHDWDLAKESDVVFIMQDGKLYPFQQKPLKIQED